MYGAKERGKGRFEFFEQRRHTEAVDRLEMRRDLQAAIDRGEFEIHYQPIFNVAGSTVTKLEALVRWNHPERGLVMPDEFVGFAEKTGLIVPIGQWVLREASAQVHRWNQEFGRRIGIAVNLSVRQLHHPGLLEDVAEALRISGLDPELLTLEITESMIMGDTKRGGRALEQLKALKVRLAIDDFGTGYSSLAYLSRLPFDTIKIDRSFVRELATSPSAISGRAFSSPGPWTSRAWRCSSMLPLRFPLPHAERCSSRRSGRRAEAGSRSRSTTVRRPSGTCGRGSTSCTRRPESR
jgi:EAL domain-containing protein (putative c-di-GMP-specific phosphodiesterase class I)